MSCRRVPTATFRFRSNSGFIFIRRQQTFQGRLCRICATGVYRDMQAYNLTAGWWGFVSLVGMVVFLIDNRKVFRRGTKALKRPLPSDPRNDIRLAGRPVFARPSVLLVLAILLTIITGLVTGGFGMDREQWEVGACVEYTDTNVSVVPCDDPGADGEVLAIVGDVFSCPSRAEFFVELTPETNACLG